MKKYINYFLFIWVMYFTYNNEEFIKKLNSLPLKSSSEAKIQFSTHFRPNYILYWQD